MRKYKKCDKWFVRFGRCKRWSLRELAHVGGGIPFIAFLVILSLLFVGCWSQQSHSYETHKWNTRYMCVLYIYKWKKKKKYPTHCPQGTNVAAIHFGTLCNFMKNIFKITATAAWVCIRLNQVTISLYFLFKTTKNEEERKTEQSFVFKAYPIASSPLTLIMFLLPVPYSPT